MKTKTEFVDFVLSLAKNFRAHQQEWENQEIDTYLETVAAYAIDVPGLYKNIGVPLSVEEPSWQLFADILLGSKYYE